VTASYFCNTTAFNWGCDFQGAIEGNFNISAIRSSPCLRSCRLLDYVPCALFGCILCCCPPLLTFSFPPRTISNLCQVASHFLVHEPSSKRLRLGLFLHFIYSFPRAPWKREREKKKSLRLTFISLSSHKLLSSTYSTTYFFYFSLLTLCRPSRLDVWSSPSLGHFCPLHSFFSNSFLHYI
jgi:hypothetical protein